MVEGLSWLIPSWFEDMHSFNLLDMIKLTLALSGIGFILFQHERGLILGSSRCQAIRQLQYPSTSGPSTSQIIHSPSKHETTQIAIALMNSRSRHLFTISASSALSLFNFTPSPPITNQAAPVTSQLLFFTAQLPPGPSIWHLHSSPPGDYSDNYRKERNCECKYLDCMKDWIRHLILEHWFQSSLWFIRFYVM